MKFEVIIIGAGPTGLTLANILGMHGIRTLIVERNAATVGEPRAVSIDDESLRTMQYIGLLDEVRSRTVQGYGSYYLSAGGKCFTRVLPDTMQYGFPRRSACRQPILEAQLRQGMGRFGCVSAQFSATAVGMAEVDGMMRVRIQDAGGLVQEASAAYVVACDGGRSPTREALGIKMSGSTYDERWLIVDLVDSSDRFRHTRVFCDPARPGLVLPGPEGTRRYEFMVLAGEDETALLEESNVRRLLAAHSAEDAGLPIARKVIYRFHARMADRWRAGRVFLAGDAAHLTPPFAGQGMNSGVRDAQNLGWKLAQALRGNLGAGILDTYETERRDHAWALIQMAVRMGRIMMPRSRAKAFLTQAVFRALEWYKPARDYVMQMKYKPQPHYTAGFVAGGEGTELRGRMFIQPVVEARSGARLLLDEVMGAGFTILLWDDGRDQPDVGAALRLLQARIVYLVPREHRFLLPDAHAEHQVRDCSGEIGALFERSGVRGVLLRPDRYVAASIGRDADSAEFAHLLDMLATAAPHALSTADNPVGTLELRAL